MNSKSSGVFYSKQLKAALSNFTGRQYPLEYLENASKLAIYQFEEKGILGNLDGRWNNRPIQRGTRFALREDRMIFAEAIDCMIEVGEAARIPDATLDGIRRDSQRIWSGIKRVRI